MRTRASLVLLPFALVALLLAGCGDDDDSADAVDSTTTEASGGDTADDGGDDAATDPGEDGDDTTTSTGGDEGGDTTTTAGGGEAPEDFCAAYEELDTIGDTQDNTTIEGLREGAQFVLDALDDVVAAAPEELQEDLALLVEASEQLKVIVDEAATPEEAEANAGDLFDDDALDAAGENVDGYYEAGCPGAADDDGADAETDPEPATIPE